MSLAEEMLATMSASDDSSTYLAEEEPHIIIDNSRTAFVPPLLKTIAVTGDHKVEKITFDCVRFWDGNDLSTFAIYLNYVLPDFSTGTYIPSSIVADNNVFHFDWDIKNNITKKSGKISFAITAIKTKENDLGETVVDKQWSSIPNGDCSIVLGIDISNVPSEEESPDILAQMSAILENIHADIDEWIKNVLVQEAGYSETKAMSQKATTLEIEKAKSDLEKEIQRNRDAIMKNSKRIENLQQGFSYQFETDSTVAYVKDVPEGSLAYAEVKKIGGITHKSENLMPISFKPQTKFGVTFSLNKDGSVSVVGTPTGSFVFYITPQFKLSAGDYFLSGCPVGGSATNENSYHLTMGYGTGVAAFDLGEGKSFTMGADYSACRVEISVAKNTVMNHTFKPMLNKGSTALPYEPYFKGLRSAEVTKVESVGANLLPYPYVDPFDGVSNGVTFNNTNGRLTLNGEATDNMYKYFGTIEIFDDGIYSFGNANNIGGSNWQLYGYINGEVFYGKFVNRNLKKDDVLQLYLAIYTGASFDNVIIEPMLNRGESVEPFTPYQKHTLPIPVEVRGSRNIFGGLALANKIKEVNPNAVIDTSAKSVTYYAPNMSGKFLLTNFKPNTRYTFIIRGIATGRYANIAIKYTDGTEEAFPFPASNTLGTIVKVSNEERSIESFIGFYSGGTTTLYYEECGVFEGVLTESDFDPYGIAGLDGYGLGVSDTVYNYIDWENEQFVKKCPMVDLGTLPWYKASIGNNTYVTSISGMQNAKTDEERRQGWICEKYNASSNVDNTNLDNKSAIRYVSGRSFYIRDDDYTDAETFKASLSGVMLVYELETPEVTDISDLISADNFIKVEGNGTLTFKNTYEYPIPSEVEYQVEV